MTHNTGFVASYMSLCLFSNDLEEGVGEGIRWPEKVLKFSDRSTKETEKLGVATW